MVINKYIFPGESYEVRKLSAIFELPASLTDHAIISRLIKILRFKLI